MEIIKQVCFYFSDRVPKYIDSIYYTKQISNP